jgi:hypothetical protein
MVRQAVVAGLLSSGCRIVDAGVCPTPTVQLLVRRLRAQRRHRDHGQPQSPGVERPEVRRARRALPERRPRPRAARHLPPGRLRQGRRAGPADARAAARCRGHAHPGRDRRRRPAARRAASCASWWTPATAPGRWPARGCSSVSAPRSSGSTSPRTAASRGPPNRPPRTCGPVVRRARAPGPTSGSRRTWTPTAGGRVGTGEPIGEERRCCSRSSTCWRHPRGPVVVNLSTTHAVEGVAARAGCQVYRRRWARRT